MLQLPAIVPLVELTLLASDLFLIRLRLLPCHPARRRLGGRAVLGLASRPSRATVLTLLDGITITHGAFVRALLLSVLTGLTFILILRQQRRRCESLVQEIFLRDFRHALSE